VGSRAHQTRGGHWESQQTVKLVGLEKILDFQAVHPDAEGWLTSWVALVRAETWKNPQEVRNKYRRASILSGNRVVFRFRGSSYRMVVRVSYEIGIVYVDRLGTHTEYEAWTL